MSAVTDYLNQIIKPLCDSFFASNASRFDLSHKDGCGKYMEALIPHLRSLGHNEVGHLKKSGSATQYNGHAIDAFLYNVPDPTLLRAVDVIGGAEAPGATAAFSIDDPRYTTADWFLVGGGTTPTNMVPWVPYDEHGFENLKKQLDYDYTRRPQGPDFDVSVWASRVFHSAYMGPDKTPLGLNAAMAKHRPEWCEALHVLVDGHRCDDSCRVGGPHHP